jgi:hypothetical protein
MVRVFLSLLGFVVMLLFAFLFFASLGWVFFYGLKFTVFPELVIVPVMCFGFSMLFLSSLFLFCVAIFFIVWVAKITYSDSAETTSVKKETTSVKKEATVEGKDDNTSKYKARIRTTLL